jgi:FG-GAP-like repeat/FG-GAP repeat
MRKAIPACLGAAMLVCLGLSGCIFYLNPQCNDQIRNGDETDVDCGGTCQQHCDIGASCSRDSDCDATEGTCEKGTCTALPCINGKLDPGETDVDCGGTCRKCAGDRKCQVGTDCASGVCEAGPQTCFSLTPSFAPAVSYITGNKGYALFAGDLDGDGHLDLVSTNELDSSVSVFLNNGDGSFRSMASGNTAYLTGFYPTGGAIADFNHDGIPDVITADYHGNSVSILFGAGSTLIPGKGTGVLGGAASYPTIEEGETSNLAVGDLNGDGNLDVIATNPGVIVPSAASMSEFLGRADGTLGPAITTQIGTAGGSQPFSAVIRDLNGDGHDDVVIGDVDTGPVIVKLGNGDGSLQDDALYPPGGVGPFFVTAFDMNLDGKLDLITANRNSDDVSVFLGRGDGTFRKPIHTSTGKMTGPYSITVADINQDGVPDVITPNSTADTVTVLLGVGDGKFDEPIIVGPTGHVPYGIAVGDFNGDGKLDIATNQALGNDVTVMLSTAQ